MNDKRSCNSSAFKQGICDRFDSYISPLPLNAAVAMAYVPFQTDVSVYDDMKALEDGTVFPVLNKPFVGQGCCR